MSEQQAKPRIRVDSYLDWIKGEGVTNSAAFIAQIEFPGTRRYVQSILARYDYYRQLFPPSAIVETRMDTNEPAGNPYGGTNGN